MYDIANMPSSIDIGFTGEKNFRKIEINMAKWMEQMPDGVPSIVHIRPGETKADAYIAATTFENNILTWLVSTSDLGTREGSGIAQVWLEAEENESVIKRGKSILFATQIRESINNASGTVPPAQTGWMEQMTALKTATVDAADDAIDAKTAAQTAQGLAEDAQEAAEAARDAAQAAAGDFQGITAEAETLDEDDPAEVEVTHEEGGIFHFEFGIPKGEKGEKGDDGDPAPAAVVEAAVSGWLDVNISNPDSPPLDRTLTYNNAATPADISGMLKNTVNAISAFKFSYPSDILSAYIDGDTGKWKGVGTAQKCIVIPVAPGDSVYIAANSSNAVRYACLKSYPTPVEDATPDFSTVTGWTGSNRFLKNESGSTSIPSDGKYLVINAGNNNAWLPNSIKVHGYDYTKSLNDNLRNTNQAIANAEGVIYGLDSGKTIDFPDNVVVGYIDGETSKWLGVGSTQRCAVIPVNSGDDLVIEGGASSTRIACLKSFTAPVNNGTPDFSAATGWTATKLISTGTTYATKIPSDGKFLTVNLGAPNGKMPAVLSINGYDYVTTLTRNITKYSLREFRVSEYSTSNKFYLSDMPARSYANCAAGVFGQKPPDIDDADTISILKLPYNLAGTVYNVWAFDRKTVTVYYNQFSTGSGINTWVKLAKNNGTLTGLDAYYLDSKDSIISAYIDGSTQKWAGTGTTYKCTAIPVSSGDSLVIEANSNNAVRYAILKSYPAPSDGTSPDFSTATGWTESKSLAKNGTLNTTVPSDGKYLVINAGLNGQLTPPKSVKVHGYDYVKSLNDNLADIIKSIYDLADDVDGLDDDIDGLSERIDGVDADIEGIEGDIDDIEGDIEGLISDVGGLTEDLGGLSTGLETLESGVDTYKEATNARIAELDAKRAEDLGRKYFTKSDQTLNGVTFDWDAAKKTCHVSGTATANAIHYVYNGSVPDSMKPGDRCLLRYKINKNQEVYGRISFLDSNNQDLLYLTSFNHSVGDFSTDMPFIVPENAVKMTVRIFVPYYSGASNTYDVTVQRFEMYRAVTRTMQEPLIISFVDDDTTTDDLVTKFHDACCHNGIKGNYAVLTASIDDGNTTAQKLLDYEDEGFGMLIHADSQTSGGHSTPYWCPVDSGGNRRHHTDEELTLCRANLNKGIREMQDFGFVNYRYWVTPGGNFQEEIIEMAKGLGLKCLISTNNRNYNSLQDCRKFLIRRISLSHATTPDDSMTYVKSIINSMVADGGGWLIVTTHFNDGWSETDTWDTTLDANGYPIGYSRFNELVQYAINAGVTPMSVPQAWEYYEPIIAANQADYGVAE